MALLLIVLIVCLSIAGAIVSIYVITNTFSFSTLISLFYHTKNPIEVRNSSIISLTYDSKKNTLLSNSYKETDNILKMMLSTSSSTLISFNSNYSIFNSFGSKTTTSGMTSIDSNLQSLNTTQNSSDNQREFLQRQPSEGLYEDSDSNSELSSRSNDFTSTHNPLLSTGTTGEVGESLQTPNAFQLPNISSLTLGNFLKACPISLQSNSSLHYRFRTEDPTGNGWVWRDVKDLNESLPVFQGNIFLKVLKLDTLSTASTTQEQVLLLNKHLLNSRRKAMLKLKEFSVSELETKKNLLSKYSTSPSPSPSPTPSTSQTSQFSSTPSTSFSTPGSTTTYKAPPKLPPKVNRTPPSSFTTQPDLFDDDFLSSNSNSPANPSSNNASSNNVTDFFASSSPSSSPSSSSTSSASIFDTAQVPAPVASSSSASSIPSTPLPSREELAKNREENIQKQVDEALKNKKMLDKMKETEENEFDQAREKHDKQLYAWAHIGKDKKNIRNLLSSLHTVLPPGQPQSKWKALSLVDVLEPGQVKKHYRKLMLVVHPDHCVKYDSESKFICKRIFEAVNEAYDDFTKKESV